MIRVSTKIHNKVRSLVNAALGEKLKPRKYEKSAPYTDKVRALMSSGKGGDGNASFMHVWCQNFAGPGGGNGGRGGGIYVVGNHKREDLHHIDLLGFHISASTGRNGGTTRCHGRSGDDLVLDVPIGTVILDVDTKQVVHDVMDEKGFLLLEGGRGGRGNSSFAHATNQAPQEFTNGLPGTSMLVQFEIKSVVDVGLIGYPNCGKSSVLSTLTTAKPRVAEWAFTTRRPMIGYVSNSYGDRISIVDMPSLVDGAFLDRGIGHLFLRHIERTIGLVYVLDMTCESTDAIGCKKSPLEVLHSLQRELEFYTSNTVRKGFMIIANKMDKETDVYGRSILESFDELQKGTDLPVFPFSSAPEFMCQQPDVTGPAASFLFESMAKIKRLADEQSEKEKVEIERKRDVFRTEKMNWLRTSRSEMGEKLRECQSLAVDRGTSFSGVNFPLEQKEAEMPFREFSIADIGKYDEDIINTSNRSLVDQQLDPYFGHTGITHLTEHDVHATKGQNALDHCDETQQGRAWRITRGTDELLTDEILKNQKPADDIS
ncbi:GTP-binding protein [Perkinsela sp. CCAP 1560/4]|nr:GTP-binding protein [Perkinsela sp. CCAP 1560/4]|eukprot:KNH04777.1 GTP-binding protein [Perkinsela sp. CCAP 1560/4]